VSITDRAASPLPPQAVVAILRAPTARHFIGASSILWDAGIRCFEFTLTLQFYESVARTTLDESAATAT
jgi:2-keto-3-deoxy-6-phosphogluconate aldolase